LTSLASVGAAVVQPLYPASAYSAPIYGPCVIGFTATSPTGGGHGQYTAVSAAAAAAAAAIAAAAADGSDDMILTADDAAA